ncbi:ABC transporter permease [Fuscibacter oryzae]|uniref:Drug:proton antiporter n=1 Tax=Fuscibacter oryzae TaxID=2803939 RepID=A0A8J7MNZ4_9RHOB|nr:FtsX-like permease family protein [Fuscibacter oryzae]MBL4926998.1 drug:proton antiporter [Fuscibacter oryzae]
MSLRLAARIARRELRGGIAGFRIFLICLALGVAAIAAVGMVRSAIEAGLSEQGAVILGGDAQAEFTYRFASEAEKAWMAGVASQVSEIVEFRSMAIAGDDQVLTQVKAVDGAYPLLGSLALQGDQTLAQAFAGKDGLPGAVMEPLLADQMALRPGDRFRLGTQEFVLAALLAKEPDSATGGFQMAPRTLVRTADLARSGLLQPGTLFDTSYRMALPPKADVAALKTEAEAKFRETGLRWTDRRRAAPGVERFVDQVGAFLILVGLSGMAVGGIGVASAVRAWVEARISTLATLRTLGADSRLIFRASLMQVAVLSGLGVTLGLAAGVGLPLLFAQQIAAALPFPATIALYWRPVFEAVFYGVTSVFLFALWPLARAARIRAAALYRGGLGGWPARRHIAAVVALAGLLIGGAAVLSGAWTLALGTAGGVLAALGLLALAAVGLMRLTRRLARLRAIQGRPALRLALAAIGGPRAGTVQVVLGLGLGLSVLAAVGQIDTNIRQAIARDLPTRAPSFFFIDIQPDQIDPFRAMIAANPAVTRQESAPMLRGVITRINGQDARKVAGDHWVVRGDRGLSYADALPAGTTITEGAWWPEGYTGTPQMSFAETEAKEMGLKLGDVLTVNVLGRDIEAPITSLRAVDFSNAGMGFVMVLNAAALQGAPHSHIATVYSGPQAEAGILRQVTKAFPNVTAISVRNAAARVAEALSAIADAVTLAALATLVTGFAVLIGAAATGEAVRRQEAAVLRVLGASRGRILWSFAMRAALTGAAAGLVAIVAGGVAGWAVMRFVMDSSYQFASLPALVVVAGGVLATLLAGLAFMLRPLAARPAQVLRSAE